MKILLIRPPDIGLGKFKDMAVAQHPINLLYLAEYVRNNHDVSVLDLQAVQMDSQELRDYISRLDPDLVGITFMTCNYKSVKEISSIARSLGKKVLLGGPHPTILPEDSIREIKADAVIRGEGELSFRETIETLSNGESLKGIQGISFLNGKEIVNNPNRPYIENLDELPLPDRGMLDLDAYRGGSTPGISKDSTVMFTSRGCAFPCIFCSARLIHGKAYRSRSIDNIFQEVDQISKLGFEHITIDDDNFTFSQKRVSDFCDRIVDYGMTWDCDSRVGLTKELLVKMRRAGCEKIAFGVESGSQRILDVIKKHINLDQIVKTFRDAERIGIKTQAFFMVGHPAETKEDVELTLKLIRKIKPSYLFVSLATPYPGTPLYDHMVEKGFIDDLDWEKYSFFGETVAWRNENFSKDELINLRNSLYRRFYLSPGYVVRSVMRIRSIDDVRYLFQGAKALTSFLKKDAG